MRPILFPSDETAFSSNGLGRLDPISCYVTEERNGQYELEMVVSMDDRHYGDIEEGRIHSVEEQEKYFNQYYEECVGEDISFDIIKLDPKYTIEQYNEMILSKEYDYEELADKFGMEEY